MEKSTCSITRDVGIKRSCFVIMVVLAAFSGACLDMNESTDSTFQSVYTIPNGIECYVDTPAYDQFSAESCWGFWNSGPLYSSVTFRLTTTVLSLLGDGGSPSFAWSDSRCSTNPYQYCTLPIRRFVPLTLQVLLTSVADGTLLYESSATAEYVTALY
jgi:hypothetical protein